jgi:hypothetical protein
MRFRPLLASVAAAGMLAAGCDYWRNLVDERTVATAHLMVKVRDNFTLETLVATCTDSGRGLTLVTALGSGQAEIPGAGTGMYTMRCHANWGYYDRIIGFPLTPPGDTVVFGLARLGGELEWYDGDPLWDVRIRERFDTLRFPGDFNFSAYPEDPALKRFRYEWTFAKARDLDQTTNKVNAINATYGKRVDTVNAVPGPDTLTLSVWSMLRKDEEFYPIGTVKRPFVWARNRLPYLKLEQEFDKTRIYDVGCPESQPLRISSTAIDPDGEGECKSIRFYTVDATSSFGAVDTTFPCTRSEPRFPLRNTFQTLLSDSGLQRESELKISVTDNNGERFDTSLVITTRSNKLPTLLSEIVKGRTFVFTGDSIMVPFELSDGDGVPDSATIDWGAGEGKTHTDYSTRRVNTLIDTGKWSYSTPGVKKIVLYGFDRCGASVKSEPGSIVIHANRNPEVKLVYQRDEGSAPNHLYVFKITPSDKDISEGLGDRITAVYAKPPGEGSRLVEPPPSGLDYTWTLRSNQPPDSLGRYKITITVHDNHDGIGTLDTSFQAPP